MFLCKQVRSEMGVDSVGVGGGEPGGPAGGALRLVVTRPVDESTRWPCASGRACSSPWRAPRPGGPSGVADPPATAVRAAASSEEIVAAVLGGPRGSVAGRLDRVGGAEVTRRRAGGRPGRRCSSPRPSPAPAAVWGCSRARVGLAEGARGPSGGLLVGGGAGSGAGRRRPPCGPLWATNRTGGAHRGGPRRWGPWSRARTAPGSLGQAGRPVAAAHDQHAPSTPLLAGPGAHAAPFKEAPSPSWIQIPSTCLTPSMPRAHGDAGSGVPGTRWSARTIGADRARGGSPGGRPPGGRRCHSMTAPAHRVGDLRDRPPAPGPAPMVDPRVVADLARGHPPGVQADDHRVQPAPSSSGPWRYRARRQASRPAPRGHHWSRRGPPGESMVLVVVPLRALPRADVVGSPFS